MLVWYADGCSSVVVNGEVVAHASQFSLKDVDLVVAQVDLDAVCTLDLFPHKLCCWEYFEILHL